MNSKSPSIVNTDDNAVVEDSREIIFLGNSILGNSHREELREINKHNIIVEIAEILGTCPTNIKKSEEIFEKIRYSMAKYILHHEYGAGKGLCPDLLLWLDSKESPSSVNELKDFIAKFCGTLE